MKKSFMIRLLTTAFVFTAIIAQAIAADVTNKLSEVLITKSDDYTYGINLVFKENFDGRAFMQNPNNGKYIVFIPDAAKFSKKINIKNQAKKMPKIKVSIDENPYVKDNLETSYLKLSITTDEDYSIKLVSQKAKKAVPFSNAIKYMIYALAVIIGSAAVTAYMLFVRSKSKNTYTVFPSAFTYSESKKNDEQKQEQPTGTTVPVNFKRTLKTAGKDKFSCFDIANTQAPQIQKDYKIQSSIKQTSVITNVISNKMQNKKSSYGQIMDEASEFDLPLADDKLKEPEKEQEQEPQFLSILNITPAKGFYLKECDGEFCLFGFVSEKSFLLKKFKDLKQINLQARFYDQDSKSDIYIVRLDSYKAMVEISELGMKELAVL